MLGYACDVIYIIIAHVKMSYIHAYTLFRFCLLKQSNFGGNLFQTDKLLDLIYYNILFQKQKLCQNFVYKHS